MYPAEPGGKPGQKGKGHGRVNCIFDLLLFYLLGEVQMKKKQLGFFEEERPDVSPAHAGM